MWLPLAALAAAPVFTFHVAGEDPGAWPDILSAAGFVQGGAAGSAGIVVLRPGEGAPFAQWIDRAEQGTFLVLEGESETAEMFGFRPGKRKIPVRNVLDARRPSLAIVWQKTLELPVFEVPAGARVFARERWSGAPLIVGFRKGAGAVLWVAVSPGERGHERFPYLVHALAELGAPPPFRSSRLWAFFDSSYRARADLDYLAAHWRKAGIGALHVAAWHFYDPDPQRAEYLRRLIDACHRRAILVYAWLELPHVSEKFWNDHPAWREKTALGQDAHLDWRKLMNLMRPDCREAVVTGVRHLVEEFDWDGVNLAELYFESLQGHENASRFTPMNDDVRREFRGVGEFDPIELFQAGSPHAFAKNPKGLRAFLDYRAALARRMQEDWIGEIEKLRASKPNLDLVLTHVDDRFDNRMRDLIGADAAGVLPQLDRHDFTFLIEDPATVWHLGPKRYQQIATSYGPLTAHTSKLAIDINIVERYQDVYPTKQQTGTELLQLVSLASRAFPRVALYFENSILAPDLPLLASAAATVKRVERLADKLVVDSERGAGVPWAGPATVDGRLWPVADSTTLWLPPGAHAIGVAGAAPPLLLTDLNAEIKSASAVTRGVEFSYRSASRAIAIFDQRPARVEIDGERVTAQFVGSALFLPRGQHLVAAYVQ